MMFYYAKVRYYLFVWVLPILLPFLFFYFSRNDSLTDSLISSGILALIYKAFFDNPSYLLDKTTKIVNQTNELFDSSKYFLYIITPYFDAGENRVKCIIDAQNNGCEVTILVRKPSEELKKLSEVGCKVLIHPRLHSKIYLNEKTAIMGSANILRGSFDNSLEVGIEVDNVSLHKEMLDMIKSYINDDVVSQFNPDKVKGGFCIKTKSSILFDVNKPMSYDAWKSRENADGMFCHSCGKGAKTSLSKPLCHNCR